MGYVGESVYATGVLRDISAERERQIKKHGDQACSSPTLGIETKIVILGEEFGEVCRAATYDEGYVEYLYKELIQTAAVAAGIAESLLVSKSPT